MGGTERQLAETALALDRAQFEPHVGCFTDGGFRAKELREAGVPILELGVRSLVSGSAVAGARRMGAYLARHGIGLVHAFDVPLDLFAVPVARFYRTPVVLSSMRAHRALTPGVTRHLLRLTDRMVDGIVVNSRAVARELAEDGVPASMVRLAYNGLDTTRFRREGERAVLPWGDETAVVIGVVCALRPEKGLGMLMEAFRKVKSARTRREAGDCGERADAGGVAGGGRCGLPFRAGGGECSAVAAGDGHFRAAFAIRSAVQFADGSDGVRLLSGRVGYRRQSGTGAGWPDGAAIPGGQCGGAGGAPEPLLDEPEYRLRLGVQAERRMHQHFTREQAARAMGGIYQEFLARGSS